MIIRRKHTKDFTVVPNSTADDVNLKADTLGVLLYLLAKPHNWQVNIANIRQRFGLGRNRVYAILNELASAGYVAKRQARNLEKQFGGVEYLVYDTPEDLAMGCASEDMDREEQGENSAETPLPGFGETANLTPPKPNKSPASLKTVKRESGTLINTQNNKPLSEELGAPEGALEEKGREDHPSQPLNLNSQIWREGAALPNVQRSCIGRWLKRVKDIPQGPETLLKVIRTAAERGTLDPVPYITAALDREFPPAPDPKAFSPDKWKTLILPAAMNTKQWAVQWGPPPGAKGCLVPPDLITDTLRRALMRRVA